MSLFALRNTCNFETQVYIGKIVEVVENFLSFHDVEYEKKGEDYDITFFKNERENQVRITITENETKNMIDFYRMRGDGFEFLDLFRNFKLFLEENDIIPKTEKIEKKIDFSFMPLPEVNKDNEEIIQRTKVLIDLSTSEFTDICDESIPILLSELKKSDDIILRCFVESNCHIKMNNMLSSYHSNITKRCILSIIQMVSVEEYRKKLNEINIHKTITELKEKTENQRIKKYCEETLLALTL
jgi:hypothetical protein